MTEIHVYSEGLVVCSVCTSLTDPAEVAQKLNALSHPGTRSGWSVSSDPTFRDGNPNPCPCDMDPARLHFLMEC